MPEPETGHHCDRICPYCDARYQVEAEDYSSRERVEECYQCKKKYWAWEDFDVTCCAYSDCAINGEAHEFPESPDEQQICQKCLRPRKQQEEDKEQSDDGEKAD